jgi:hypothetical protein
MKENSLLLLLTLFLVACPAPEEQLLPPVQEPQVEAPIRTDQKQYVFREGPSGLETTIVATLNAPADQILYIMNCNGAISTGLQRKVGEEWVDAWIPPINGCLSPPLEIPPGGEMTQKLTIRPGHLMYPPNGQQLESGTYRVAWHNVFTSYDSDGPPFGDRLPLEQRVSAPFSIDLPAR